MTNGLLVRLNNKCKFTTVFCKSVPLRRENKRGALNVRPFLNESDITATFHCRTSVFVSLYVEAFHKIFQVHKILIIWMPPMQERESTTAMKFALINFDALLFQQLPHLGIRRGQNGGGTETDNVLYLGTVKRPDEFLHVVVNAGVIDSTSQKECVYGSRDRLRDVLSFHTRNGRDHVGHPLHMSRLAEISDSSAHRSLQLFSDLTLHVGHIVCRLKAGYDFSFAVDKELSEAPLDVAALTPSRTLLIKHILQNLG